MLAVHLHQNWDHGLPMEDEERVTRMWEENLSTVINDLNHCEICVTRHTNPSGQTEATHTVEDNPEADRAIQDPQTGKVFKKKRMYINLTEVNIEVIKIDFIKINVIKIEKGGILLLNICF